MSRLAPAPPLTQACSQYASLLPCAALIHLTAVIIDLTLDN